MIKKGGRRKEEHTLVAFQGNVAAMLCFGRAAYLAEMIWALVTKAGGR